MIKKAIIRVLKYFPLTKKILAIYLLQKKYLNESGWLLSVEKGMPLDKEGQELPWLTYSSILFLAKRLNKKLTVFEYGSGNSTIWFGNKAKSIISVEHSKEWHSKFKKKLQGKSNIKYFYRGLDSKEYQNEILNYNKEFDIIVIDGRERVQCGINAIGALKEKGVIIWDNTEYEEGYEFLISNGFKRIDFWGIGAINASSWCTSIFYKKENCFEL